MSASVSIIIPTTASPGRAPLLRRALRSLQEDQNHAVVPIVVVNGSRFVSDILGELKRRRDIRCLYVDKASHTNARLEGRRMVQTQYFGLLDDDDEYLPGAVPLRLAALTNDPSLDGVITNGYSHDNGQDRVQFTGFSACQGDPLGSLMDNNWLHSAGALFHTARVSTEYFCVPRSMELTYMALMLALTRRLQFLDVPTYRFHRGTPESLSAMRTYYRDAPQAIRQMMALVPPTQVRRRLLRRYAASLHELSDLERRDGKLWTAWRYHLKSLTLREGLRYLPYTRHLLRLTVTLRLSGEGHESH